MEDNVAGEGFHGVYLLYCINPRFKGHTYIGYTVNPNRRIKQHNGGVEKGGANKTSRKKPWEMILIVHGFPNDIIALQFEWAWQNPHITRRLKYVGISKSKRSKERAVDYCFRVLSHLLRVGPWNRMPLTIRWLIQDYKIEFDALRLPPVHMPVTYGPLENQKKSKKTATAETDKGLHRTEKCVKCNRKFKAEEKPLRCPKPGCIMTSHLFCLAGDFLKKEHEETSFCLPVDGPCPVCKKPLLWGELVRPKQDLPAGEGMGNNDKEHWTQQLRL